MSDKIIDSFDDFIVYLDDDDTRVEAYVIITEISSSYVFFRTKANNSIMIPMHRVLKIKRKRGISDGNN